MNKSIIKLLILLVLVLGTDGYSQTNLIFTSIPNPKVEVCDKVSISWSSNKTNVEFRYKLDMPGDFRGGIKYLVNKWSNWGNNNNIIYNDFLNEGKYTFSVEARKANSKKSEKISTTFTVYFVMPEILDGYLNIDLAKVEMADTESEKFKILAKEYREQYIYWNNKFEFERKRLKLTVESDVFIRELIQVVGEESVNKGISGYLKDMGYKSSLKIFRTLYAAKTLHDILKNLGRDAVLILRNVKTNKALINAHDAYLAMKYYEAKSDEFKDYEDEFKDNELDWTLTYDNPVELAKEIIKRYPEVWHPVTKTSIYGVYGVGKFVSQYGGEYLFLQTPNLMVDFVTGGTHKVAHTITKDVLLELIRQTIKTPKVICRELSSLTIKEGLKEYDKAYRIARKYKKTKEISYEEAKEFLDNRFGILKLPGARKLYNENAKEFKVSKEEVYAKKTMEELNELIKEFDDGFGAELTTSSILIILRDFYLILEESQISLVNYPPYKKFNKNMTYLNSIRHDERLRWNPSFEITYPNYKTIWDKKSNVEVDWISKNFENKSLLKLILAKNKERIEEYGPFPINQQNATLVLKQAIENGNDYKLFGYEVFPKDPDRFVNHETDFFAIMDSNKELDDSQRRIRFAGRRVSYLKTITVDGDIIELKLWDHGQQDGDVVSIYLSGKSLLSNYMLTKEKRVMKVKLDPNRENDLFLYAHNVGEIPPNTVSFEINHGHNSDGFVLNSDLQNCEAVLIYVK